MINPIHPIATHSQIDWTGYALRQLGHYPMLTVDDALTQISDFSRNDIESKYGQYVKEHGNMIVRDFIKLINDLNCAQNFRPNKNGNES